MKKAKTAWNLIKYSSITNKNIDKTLRIYLLKAIIQSILTYSLHLFYISPSILLKLQAFYSMCIRKVYTGPHNPNIEIMTNLDIRRDTKTPTLESLLYTRYLNQIFTWKETQSPAYLNNKVEIDTAFKTFDDKISTLINDLTNTNECICNSHTSCIKHNYIKWYNSSKKQKQNILIMLNKINKLDNFTSSNLTHKTYNKPTQRMLKLNENPCKEAQNHASCPTCDNQFRNQRCCNVHQVRNKNCQVHYKLTKLTPIICPNDNCNTIWYCNKQLQNISNTTATSPILKNNN